jgi:hypothetical protein
MRAGYGVRYRVHGLDLTTTPFVVGLGPNGPDGQPDGTIEFAREPQMNLQSMETSVFIVRGSGEYFARVRGGDFEGCYMTIVISGTYEVPTALSSRFAEASAGEAELGEVEALLERRIAAELRPGAQLTAALAASRLMPLVAEPWLEFKAYWPTTGVYKARYASPATEVLDRIAGTEEYLKDIAEHIVIGRVNSSDLTRALELAGYWYVVGRSSVAGSRERFLGLFQCIEALTNCAPQQPNDAIAQWLEDIAILVASSGSDKAANLLDGLSDVRQRVSRPVLAERFERLLRLIDLPNVDNTLRQFSALNKVRNDLLHAHIAEIPSVFRGYDVDKTLTGLAGGLFAAVSSRIVAKARDQGVSIRFIDPKSIERQAT